jgi:hypothetical protein
MDVTEIPHEWIDRTEITKLGPNDERYYFLLQYSVVGLEATDWTTEEL